MTSLTRSGDELDAVQKRPTEPDLADLTDRRWALATIPGFLIVGYYAWTSWVPRIVEMFR